MMYDVGDYLLEEIKSFYEDGSSSVHINTELETQINPYNSIKEQHAYLLPSDELNYGRKKSLIMQ